MGIGDGFGAARGDERTLQRWVGAQTSPQRTIRRARVVLLAAQGLANRRVAQEVGTSRPTVRRWRKRFMTRGVPALLEDAPVGASRLHPAAQGDSYCFGHDADDAPRRGPALRERLGRRSMRDRRIRLNGRQKREATGRSSLHGHKAHVAQKRRRSARETGTNLSKEDLPKRTVGPEPAVDFSRAVQGEHLLRIRKAWRSKPAQSEVFGSRASPAVARWAPALREFVFVSLRTKAGRALCGVLPGTRVHEQEPDKTQGRATEQAKERQEKEACCHSIGHTRRRER